MLELAPNSVLIQDHLSKQPRWLAFRRPVEIIRCGDIAEVMPCLEHVEAQAAKGLFAAGFLSYEASAAMDDALQTHALEDFPLLWFGLYEEYQVVELPEPAPSGFVLENWQPSVSLREYYDCIAEIKGHIRRGATYQVNYSLRLRNSFAGDPWQLFLTLYNAQRGRCAAYLNLDRYHICSVSPELFFSLEEGRLTCKPMKGTAQRGHTTAEDGARERWLLSSEKNRAENIMIVDMIRSDLGRIADAGSVRVQELFAIERYPTLLQMTSTVTSQTSATISQIFRAMFPCASITGAPKVRTMDIIRQLEPGPRGVYTGSIGYIAPGAKSEFSVAIRTAVVDVAAKSVEYGVGGGIVWDSHPDEEYNEYRTKASILAQRAFAFDLIETCLWEPDAGIYLLSHHLDRLRDSAAYFNFQFSMDRLQEKLGAFAPAQGTKARVRIILARAGEIRLESTPLVSIRRARVGLARRPMPAPSPLLFHKTTCRDIYQALLDDARAQLPGIDDVILWNAAGFVTESGRANIVIADGGELATPPVDEGLLAGVFRRRLIEECGVIERRITVQDLLRSDAVFLVNSLRGWMPLDPADADTWVIRSDLCYAAPEIGLQRPAAPRSGSATRRMR